MSENENVSARNWKDAKKNGAKKSDAKKKDANERKRNAKKNVSYNNNMNIAL